ncbi:MAG: hypothetical protein PWQ25_1966 [Deferribacteres bacterium]|jgi:hypothetical protein|nr:hypothetical protein [Deferribacteraceae bacterium]MDK2793103.1 hypothetical protein [Deferribacteres bacterium]
MEKGFNFGKSGTRITFRQEINRQRLAETALEAEINTHLNQ